ncbi:helicase [Muribaculaceae bacterium Isolate-039 (Harlan)]|jgi:tetratricopeptide (TPR) repeat protein|uniref:AAA family ATPase n=3 Tax=Muribaculaceae TaxID=2005473 RepID=UPI000F45FA65|nr:AAA family ATPase [Duncaniella muris]NBH91911.1 helicase [Muribaculaceae bacterium S4]NBI20282.1 helicase [Muribaculaceae bacterium Z1]ROS86371.1 helicase [Muribaculaceae bacterium Isolate-039 (Harlan)]ROS96473.1 helicase [Muribaculaceae bacterium Isolate-077 (Janvier)]ROS98460.1 helicase [Muribaculaceae bacterium Isolate-083 (Janvier)]ROT00308.1 helicase [Muribaculaceae bacterium Isolate-084 (Janvier)]
MAKKSSRPARRIVADRNDNIDLDNPEFIKAWELLQHTKQSIFLTGKAGTGKSTFLRYITAHTRKKYVVLAPTGIAAVNVGGVTLHSFFRIPFKPIVPGDPDFAPNRIKERMKYPGSLVKLIRELELIIIDEISMVRADIIDFVDLLLRTYSGNQREPFGGKQLLFVGDVFQLEPVLTGDMRDILRKFYRDAFFFSAHAFDRINLVPIELRKIYRQSQGEFVELLDRIRMGAATAADISRLNSRCVALSLPVEGEEKPTMTLASRRDMVDQINESRLEAIDKPVFTFIGEIKKDFPENSLPTDLELSLKEGAQVVFIKNSPDRFWVNGTIGTVTTITQDLLEVRLENGEIHEVEPEKWSNIKYSFDEKTNKIIETELGSFTQYPVKLAWALTIHKSQGLTFNNVIIDLGRGAFTGGQTYVALSRCRSFEGLTLRSTVAERDIFVNPAILNFSRSFNDPILIDGAMRKAHAEECYENALAKADEGDFSEAFDLFAEGLRAKSILDNKSAMRLARSKLAVIGKLRERVAQLESDIAADRERFRDMAMEYTSLGDDCRIDEMPLPAIANYDKALALLPGHIPALYGRALAAITLEDYSRALDDLGEVVRLDPANFDAMVRMGMTYYRMDDVHNAMDRCLVALSLSETADCPRQALHGLHSLLADIYDTAGDKSSAHHHREIARRLRK